MTDRPCAAVILAAGLGKRMKSARPKVLHEICGAPLIGHVLDAIEASGVGRIYVITGHGSEEVRAAVGPRAACIEQTERLGTGHAVMQAGPALADFDGDVLVTCGDMPLISAATYRRLLARRSERNCAAVLLTAIAHGPTGFGRIIRGAGDTVARIVEERDATEEERRIREVNAGSYCFDARLLFAALARIDNKNAQGEYYLTDVPAILLADRHAAEAVVLDDPAEMIGINSRAQLAEAAAAMNGRFLAALMDAGVTVIDPSTTHVDRGVTVGLDSVLHPGSILRGRTRVGARCVIGPHTELIDATIGDGATVRQSVVEGGAVPAGAVVGPFAHVKD